MVKNFIFGYALALLSILACAPVAYKYYGLQLPNYSCYEQGKLLGPTEEEDLSLNLCKPEPGRAGKCVVMESAEFFEAKKELNQLRVALEACQKGAPPQ